MPSVFKNTFRIVGSNGEKMPKIMLCDDSKTILKILEKKLSDAGYQIVGSAKDGEEGAKVFSETKPDLTLLDVTMPNRDGRDCLKDILQINPAAKVIMISALQEESIIKECLAAGAKAFITKSKIYDESDFKKEILAVIESVLKAA